MSMLPKQIMEYASRLPEGTPIYAKAFLGLGNRAAVDQALSRLCRRKEILRVGRGIYFRVVKTRFGVRAPSTHEVVQRIAEASGEIIVPNGAAAANALGLTTQVPVREQYLTSGRSRRLRLGAQIVELKHAPVRQLARPGRVGEAIRALTWLGHSQAREALTALKSQLPEHELQQLSSARLNFPPWLAKAVSNTLTYNG